MIRQRLLAVALLLGFGGENVATAAPPELVGGLRFPECIVFEGQRTFSEQQLIRRVANNLQLIVARHPRSKLDRYLSVLRQNVESGFLRAGFPKAAVRTTYDEDREKIVVTIDEGPRYIYGKIRFIEKLPATAERIRDFLTQWRPRKSRSYDFEKATAEKIPFTTTTSSLRRDPPLWFVDQPASFYEPDMRRIERSIREQFERAGYLNADFMSHFHGEEDGTVTLEIAVADEGTQATLGTVEITGLQRNSHDDVVAFLGLVKGMNVNSDIVEEAHQKLRSSARFFHQEVKIVSSPDDQNTSNLQLSVYENPKAPLLREELSEVQQAMLRIGSWLEGLAFSDEDLLIEVNVTPAKDHNGQSLLEPQQITYFCRVVFSPHRHEGLVNFRILNSAQAVLFDVTLNVRREQMSFDSGSSRFRCEMPGSGSHFIGDFELKSHAPDKDGYPMRVIFGFGLATNSPEDDSAFRPVCDPAAVLGSVSDIIDLLKIEENKLIYEGEAFQCRFDANSGRLLSLTGRWDEQGKATLKIEFARHLYDKSKDEHASEVADWPTVQFNQCPCSAIVSLLSGYWPLSSGGRPPNVVNRLPALAERWRKQELLNWHPEPEEPEMSLAETFVIPFDRSAFKGPAEIYGIALPLLGHWFPESSWAWSMTREFAMIHLGKPEFSNSAIASLLKSDETGPVANLTGAFCFGFFSPRLQTEFANRCRDTLDLRHFRFDYQPFLRADAAVGQALIKLGKLLQDCDADEIEQLVELLPLTKGVKRDAVIRSLSQFRRQSEQSVLQTLPLAIDALWEPIIRPRLEDLLSRYGTSTPTTVERFAALKVGDKVFLKDISDVKDGDMVVDNHFVAFPATIHEIDGDRLRLGKIWIRANDAIRPDEAISYFTKRIREDLTRVSLWISRGLIHFKMREFDEALEDLTVAIHFDPDSPEAYSARASVWLAKAEMDKALKDCNDAIRLDPQASRFYVDRSTIWKTKGDFENELSDLIEAYRLDQDNAQVQNAIAWLRATCPEERFRNGDEAVIYATKACNSSDWKHSHYLDTLAAAYAESGDFANAIKWAEKALEQRADDQQMPLAVRIELYRTNKPFRDVIATATKE